MTFLDELPPGLVARIRAAGRRRELPAQATLFHQGDPENGVFLVEAGLVRIDRTLSNGRQVLLALARPGDIVGELSVLDGSVRSARATTLVPSAVVIVPARVFAGLLRAEPDLAVALLGRVGARLRATTDRLMEVSAHRATSRVAARLAALLELAGADDGPECGPVELRLPVTQEELAQWAGLSREGAVKALSELRASGIIETGRRRVVVNDPDALRRAAAAPEP
jgi:CRP-like cAMP-binding protein